MEVHKFLEEQISNYLKIDFKTLSKDQNLIDAGLDSLRFMEIVENIEEFGLSVEFEEIAQYSTLDDWIRYILKNNSIN